MVWSYEGRNSIQGLDFHMVHTPSPGGPEEAAGLAADDVVDE